MTHYPHVRSAIMPPMIYDGNPPKWLLVTALTMAALMAGLLIGLAVGWL
jgi:hypothetical protein